MLRRASQVHGAGKVALSLQTKRIDAQTTRSQKKWGAHARLANDIVELMSEHVEKSVSESISSMQRGA